MKELDAFLAYHPIPDECFERPAHVAVTCSSTEHFDDRVDEIKKEANEVYYARLDDRRIASAWCMGAVSLGQYGSVHWVEVELRSPARDDTVGFKHAGFLYSHLDALSNDLDDNVIGYEFQSDKNHSWITVPINKVGYEVKFSDKHLGEIIRQGVSVGEVQLL